MSLGLGLSQKKVFHRTAVKLAEVKTGKEKVFPHAQQMVPPIEVQVLLSSTVLLLRTCYVVT